MPTIKHKSLKYNNRKTEVGDKTNFRKTYCNLCNETGLLGC